MTEKELDSLRGEIDKKLESFIITTNRQEIDCLQIDTIIRISIIIIIIIIYRVAPVFFIFGIRPDIRFHLPEKLFK